MSIREALHYTATPQGQRDRKKKASLGIATDERKKKLRPLLLLLHPDSYQSPHFASFLILYCARGLVLYSHCPLHCTTISAPIVVQRRVGGRSSSITSSTQAYRRLCTTLFIPLSLPVCPATLAGAVRRNRLSSQCPPLDPEAELQSLTCVDEKRGTDAAKVSL
jgi:hypothetical protein